jgi:hypothetical protein
MTLIGITAKRISRLLSAGLIALATLIPSLAMADIYKWTGDDGKINYTQMPPPKGIPSELIRQTYLAPEPPAATKSPEGNLKARLEEEQKDLERDAARTEQDKKNADIRRLNCDAATRNLAVLEEAGQRNYMTASGEYLRPTEKERKKLIATAKQQVKDYCTK